MVSLVYYEAIRQHLGVFSAKLWWTWITLIILESLNTPLSFLGVEWGHWSKHGALMTQSDTVIWIDVWKTSACRSLYNGDKEDQQIISSANRNNKTEPPVLQESSVSWICKVLNPAKKRTDSWHSAWSKHPKHGWKNPGKMRVEEVGRRAKSFPSIPSKSVA